MKKVLLALFIILSINISKAESTLVLFYNPNLLYNVEYEIKVNGIKLEKTEPPIKKVKKVGQEGNVMTNYEKSYKTILFPQEGKYVISVNIIYTPPMSGSKKMQYWGEGQYLMEDGDEVYIEIARKGLNDIKLNELNTKNALKKINSGKYFKLPASIF